MQIDTEGVRGKVRHLVETMSISKTRLGDVLGGKKDEDMRVRINRANRFLSGKQKRISLEQVNALANFFQKPIEWFLFGRTGKSSTSYKLSSSQKNSPQDLKPLRDIRKNLEKMGFDESFIEAQVLQLKAMAAYNAGHE